MLFSVATFQNSIKAVNNILDKHEYAEVNLRRQKSMRQKKNYVHVTS